MTNNIHILPNQEEIIYFDKEQTLDDLDILVDDKATLELLIYNSCCKINAKVLKDATLIIYNVCFTKTDNNYNLTIDLNEQNAKVQIINVYLGLMNAKVESNIMINHNHKNTMSNLENYAIAKNEAQLLLNNNAYIVQGMHQSEARQLTKGLNLSKESKILAQPNLFIDEYDVVASHSASIGSIDKEDLFYLMSRGLKEDAALELVVLGFIQPILANIKNEQLQNTIYSEFSKLLK